MPKKADPTNCPTAQQSAKRIGGTPEQYCLYICPRRNVTLGTCSDR